MKIFTRDFLENKNVLKHQSINWLSFCLKVNLNADN